MVMDEEEPQQQIPYPSGIIAGGLAEAGALAFQFEAQELMDTLIHVFRGEAKVINKITGLEEWHQVSPPMINEKGLSVVRQFFSLMLGGQKIFALTDLDRDYVSSELEDIGRDFVNDIYDNWEVYEVPKFSTASYIVRWTTMVAKAVLSKGEDANYLNFLTKTHNIQEIQHHQGMMQNRSSEEGRRSLFKMLFSKKR